ncbi:MAG: hypothetical protein ACYCZB_18000 [Acidiphilium sp.]
MLKSHAAFLIRFSQESTTMLGHFRHDAAQAAFRAFTLAGIDAGSGLDLAHVPVAIGGLDYAASSRVMPSGTVVIALDVAPAGLTPRVITGEAWRAGLLAARARGARAAR